MQLFVKSTLSFEAEAEQIAAIALPGYQHECGDGLNLGGGDYYKFWRDDSVVLLVVNDAAHSEVFIPARSEFSYYLYVRRGPESVLGAAAAALSGNGILCELADEA
jgi:hypothetical protein